MNLSPRLPLVLAREEADRDLFLANLPEINRGEHYPKKRAILNHEQGSTRA